ncbi:MAG: nitroreductase family protein [Candidatus Bathyarchaeota archaeon]|nr:nitroreductase family protein [Candidatus Bathyarchaeota archaeon]
MDVFDAINKRRSIRKFTAQPVSDIQIERLIKAAHLAPSGCNVQPWRFVIVKDKQLKHSLCVAAHNQKFVEKAPVVIVCCGELLSWKKTREQTQELLNKKGTKINKETENALMNRVDQAVQANMNERVPTTLLNVAIAIEHIVLEAVELGLGSCWVRLFDENQVKQALRLKENICVVALLPIGFPDEDPAARPRVSLSSIILPVKNEEGSNQAN